VEEGNLVFTREKLSALDLNGRIQTVRSKCAPRTAKFHSPRLPEVATLGRSSDQFDVCRPERIILGDRGVSGGHFGA